MYPFLFDVDIGNLVHLVQLYPGGMFHAQMVNMCHAESQASRALSYPFSCLIDRKTMRTTSLRPENMNPELRENFCRSPELCEKKTLVFMVKMIHSTVVQSGVTRERT